MEEIKIVKKAYKFKIEKHKEIKDDALKAIETMGTFSYIHGTQKISNTDWHLGGDIQRPYIDIVNEPLAECYTKLNMIPNNFWFQQYNKGDYHGKHTHASCNWTSIYFLELPNTTMKTKLDDNEIEVEEGDYLIFPADIQHSSPINTSENRKTSIVINLTDGGY